MVFPAKKFNVQIDSFTSSYPAYELSAAGWNGWACPGFVLEIAQKMVEEFFPTCEITYDPVIEVFTFRYADGMIEEFAARTVITVDGPMKLYPIGAWGWAWEEVDK